MLDKQRSRMLSSRMVSEKIYLTPLPKSLTPMLATARFAEMLENLQHIPES
jgi:hypothetical protein